MNSDKIYLEGNFPSHLSQAWPDTLNVSGLTGKLGFVKQCYAPSKTQM